MRKKYLFILIGLAFELQLVTASQEEKGRLVDVLFDFRSGRIDSNRLEKLLSAYTKDELSSSEKGALTPLMWSLGSPELVEKLLKCGANPRVQVNGQDALTVAFKKAYIQGNSYSVALDILKENMEVAREEGAACHALEQRMVFTPEEKNVFMTQYLFGESDKSRNYKLVYGIFFESKGKLTKAAKKK